MCLFRAFPIYAQSNQSGLTLNTEDVHKIGLSGRLNPFGLGCLFLPAVCTEPPRDMRVGAAPSAFP